MKKIMTLLFIVSLISFGASAQQTRYRNNNTYNNSWQYQNHSSDGYGYYTPYNNYGNSYSDRYYDDRHRRYERDRYHRLRMYRDRHYYDRYDRRRTGISFRLRF